MGGSTRSTTSTSNQAIDNRTFIDDRDFTRTDITTNYDIDNSVRNDFDIDNSVNNDIDQDIDNSVRTDIDDSFNTTTNNSTSTVTEDSYNSVVDNSITVGEEGIYAGGDVQVTDLGAITEAFDFAENSFNQVLSTFGDVISLERASGDAALSDLSNTIAIGGLVAGVSLAAIGIYLVWRK